MMYNVHYILLYSLSFVPLQRLHLIQIHFTKLKLMNLQSQHKMETSNGVQTIKSNKIDSITEIQDSIDSLSLSLFEALRGLRDAISPESQTNTNTNGEHAENIPQSPQLDLDYDDFLMAFHRDEQWTLELIAKNKGNPPKNKEEYTKLKARIEMEKFKAIVEKHSTDILQKSANVDDLVSNLPGMSRTKKEQLERIQELLTLNQSLDKELNDAYTQAETQRNEIRSILDRVTTEALGI